MLFSVAGLRRYAAVAFTCLSLSSLADARNEIFFTSSVSYCEPPELILVQQFDIVYFAANESIFFNISAASVEDNVNVTANLALNVYGLHLINITIDLCTLLNGALCPLPTYNFVGSETLSLAALDIGIASKIPGIAYKVPDLEAFAQLTLTRVDTNEVKACVQSTLSNGWTTRQLAVEWVTGGFAIFALFSALISTLLASPSRAPQRFVDLLLLLQTIAASALLDLNYPVLYRAFALNFSWALGLFGASGGSKIQTAINNMRHHTGGDMSDTSGGDGVDLVNRKLSPYNVAIATSAETRAAVKSLQSKIAANQLLASGASKNVSDVAQLARRGATVTVTNSNVLDAGIPVYVNSLGISTANAFMSVFFTLLMLAAIALVVVGLGWLVLVLLSKRRERQGRDPGRLGEWKQCYAGFSKAWTLRLIFIVFLPVMIFSFHQWTLKDSWLATLFSVLTLLAVLVCVLYPSFLTIRFARRSRPDSLYEEHQYRNPYGLLYTAYRPPRWFFFTICIAVLFVRAIVTAFGYASGIVQLIFIMIAELSFLISTLVLRPHTTRGGDVLSSTLSIARVLIAGLSFAFVESFNVGAIARVVIGAVAAVVASLCVVLMFINVILNFGLRALWREHVLRHLGTRLGSTMRLGTWGRISPGGSRGGSAKNSIMDEKRGNDITSQFPTERSLQGGAGADIEERPRNPISPFDSSINSPYPAATPTSASSSSKMFQRNSDYRVSYASSQMPSTGTTLDSFGHVSSSLSSADAESTFGTELPRRAAYEGLGLDHSDQELGSSESSGSSPPQSRRASRMGGWAQSAALLRMSEDGESESDQDERRLSPRRT